MVRPNPTPDLFYFAVSSSLEKFWNSFLRFSSEMPTPVSLMMSLKLMSTSIVSDVQPLSEGSSSGESGTISSLSGAESSDIYSLIEPSCFSL